MAKRSKALTKAAIDRMKPPTAGRIEVFDALVPGFGIRVSDKGRKTYFVMYRVNRRLRRMTIGSTHAISLEAARDEAREALRKAQRGEDAATERKARETEATENTVAKAVERWLRLVVIGPDETKPKQRQGAKVARDVRREIVGRWGARPVEDIGRRDIIELVHDIAARGTPAMARNVLGHTKVFFGWCEAVDLIDLSPATAIKPKALLGEKPTRKRVLADNELFALWRVSGRLGYPFGPMYRLLLVTGQRLDEVAAARWPEFHPELVRLLRQRKDDDPPIQWNAVPDHIKLWTVGADRFKSDAPQMVPLSDAACEALATLPFFAHGDHLFSTTFGERPVSGFGKAKARLDRAMLRTLRAAARRDGDDSETVELPHFVNHDLRRTLRTRLSGLRVRDEVAEMVIGHGRKGIQRVYDQHRYEAEMREALTLWAGRLWEIAAPSPENVVPLQRHI